MLTLAEAAERLNLSHTTLRVQVRNGKLRARKVGPVWTVSEREVDRYAAENRRLMKSHTHRFNDAGVCGGCGASLTIQVDPSLLG